MFIRLWGRALRPLRIGLYDAAVQLERAVAVFSYARNECSADLKKYCASVEAGESGLLECLQKNEAQVSNRFKLARKDVGMM